MKEALDRFRTAVDDLKVKLKFLALALALGLVVGLIERIP